jgi:hypothetical protein
MKPRQGMNLRSTTKVNCNIMVKSLKEILDNINLSVILFQRDNVIKKVKHLN